MNLKTSFGQKSLRHLCDIGGSKNVSSRHFGVKMKTNQSGQIIATSHDLTSNGGLVRENPLFQGNLGW